MTRPAAIHQFHNTAAAGDAVTNGLLFIRGLLRSLGYASEIYVYSIMGDGPEGSGVRHYRTYATSPEQVLLVHHSHGHDLEDWVMGLKDRQVLVYHNITPAHHFPKGSALAHYSEVGRRQLVTFRARMAASICDSEFNAADLRELGYQNVFTIPLLFDADAIQAAPWDGKIVEDNAGKLTVLFVGRIVANKRQHELVQVLQHLRRMAGRPVQLVLVGPYEPYDLYHHLLKDVIDRLGLADCVRITGKVSPEALYGWYRTAGAFVCLSEHEGFGVPLVEAMLLDVPVIAFKSSNVPNTLGGAGILVTEKRFEEIAALVALLDNDRAFRRAVLLHQRARVEALRPAQLRARLAAVLATLGVEVSEAAPASTAGPPRPPTIQVEGPCLGRDGAAAVNRELALALARRLPGQVALLAAANGSATAEPDVLRVTPGLEELLRRGRRGSRAGVVVRHTDPLRVADMDGLINIAYFSRPDPLLDPGLVNSFNRHLDGLVVPSAAVRKALIDGGVRRPIIVAGDPAGGAGEDCARRLMELIEQVKATRPLEDETLPNALRPARAGAP
jgi:glycosyltransferase involved in cell wall biosynthesis